MSIHSSPNLSISMGGKDYDIKYDKILKKSFHFSTSQNIITFTSNLRKDFIYILSNFTLH